MDEPASFSGECQRVRYVGIDALRVFAMLGVVLLHVLGQGGVLAAAPCRQRSSLLAPAAWLLEVMAYPAVDAFAIVSGYVGYGGRHRPSSAAKLCASAVFFDLLATVAAIAMGVNLGARDLLGSLAFPYNGVRWYLCCTTSASFPSLGLIVGRWARGEREARRVAIAIIVVLSALPTLLHADLARTGRGYSMAWLAALYVIGACMRRFGWLSRLRGRKGLAAYVLDATLSLEDGRRAGIILAAGGADGHRLVHLVRLSAHARHGRMPGGGLFRHWDA